MFDKATGRVVAVIVLLILIAASLRGYLPGVERATRPKPPDSGGSLAYVGALLSVSLIIVAVALVTRLRNPRRTAASSDPLPQRFSAGSRPGWKMLTIGAGVLVAWLLTVWLLSRFVVLPRAGQVPNAPASGTPTPANNAAQPPVPPAVGGDNDVLHYLIAGTVALLVLIVVGAVAGARRQRLTGPGIVAAEPLTSPPTTATSESLMRAAEIGLAEIEDLTQEPREAIIACYAAMERELTRVPGAMPQDFDTPMEVLARAVELHALHVDNATQLVTLFEEARFSPHVMNEGHRESALRVLQLVLAELRSVV
ncbi:MAG: DUF4129 domain-containing protein [Mycobacterium sp.]|nr:DUF4129 domain-containing protein [Mycobacterium sp.]